MIYTTLKANREAGINFVDFIDECITVIGRFFGEEYVDENDYTNWDKLSEDFSKSKIESIVLKSIKEDAKDKEDGIFFKYGKILIERDYAFDDIRKAVQLGLLNRSDLHKIEKQSQKYNFRVRKEGWDETGTATDKGDWTTWYMDDIIDEFFPCGFDEETGCLNCGNCA